MSKDSLTVYWSPSQEVLWNILYEEPENLYKNLLKQSGDNLNKSNFFNCPSFQHLAKNAFLIKNPIKSSFRIENKEIIPTSKNYMNSQIIHNETLKNNILFEYGLSYLFFCEEDLNAFLLPPFLHNTSHQKYGAIVPGRWNCGSWLRTIHNEFNLWDNVTEISFEEGEPLSYLYFDTDRQVNLQRFEPTPKIFEIVSSCASAPSWERGVSLFKRYKRFKNSQTNKIVLEEIKRNLVN